jgi:hypothetical protein
MMLSLSMWELYNVIEPHAEYNLGLPNCLAVLTWWKYLQLFVQLLDVSEERVLDGRLVVSVPRSVSAPPKPRAVECHFHPDVLLANHFRSCTTWSQVERAVRGRSAYPLTLQYLVANLVFPRHFHMIDMLCSYETMKFSFGVHPNCNANPDTLTRHMQEVVRLVDTHCARCVGIGETGLDYQAATSSSRQSD